MPALRCRFGLDLDAIGPARRLGQVWRQFALFDSMWMSNTGSSVFCRETVDTIDNIAAAGARLARTDMNHEQGD